MSRYDEYDCEDLGCGPEFCDWPHCKTPLGEPGRILHPSAKVTVTIHADASQAIESLRRASEHAAAVAGIDPTDPPGPLAHYMLDQDGHIQAVDPAQRCVACQVPQTEPHADDCAILWGVLDGMRDQLIPAVPPGTARFVAGHPFYGPPVDWPGRTRTSSDEPPPAAVSQVGPDRGE